MKLKIAALSLCIVFSLSHSLKAQDGFGDILTFGIEDANRFAQSYLNPGAEAFAYSFANAWFNSAKSKKTFRFDLQLVAGAALASSEDKRFLLDPAQFNHVEFRDGNPTAPRNVATVFGANRPDVVVRIPSNNPLVPDAEVTLPQGLGDTDVNFLPTGFLQASFGLPLGLEIKARFIPKTEIDEVESQLFGLGLQYELDRIFGVPSFFPVRFGALVGYTNFEGSYDFEDGDFVSGTNQKVDVEVDTWLFTLIASTNLKIINVYGGVGYVTGNTTSRLLGTYQVNAGIVPVGGTTLVDPISINTDVSGLRANLGLDLKLGFFGVYAEYAVQEYDTFNAGIRFGWL
ncbi:MAG: DUF6588 family protein [Flavobacteriaceae bacterium]|nr:DUF6588 family protein [Flavobacteriaceae bacterium]